MSAWRHDRARQLPVPRRRRAMPTISLDALVRAEGAHDGATHVAGGADDDDLHGGRLPSARLASNQPDGELAEPMTPKLLFWALGIQVVLGGLLIWQAASDFSLFRDEGGGGRRQAGGGRARGARAARRPLRRGAGDGVGAPPGRSSGRGRPARTPSARPPICLRAALPDGRFVGLGPANPSRPSLRNIEGSLPGPGPADPPRRPLRHDTGPRATSARTTAPPGSAR